MASVAATLSIATTAGRHDFAAWTAFFSAFSPIVLVANSDPGGYRDLRSCVSETALFIYFNRVDRVLDAPTRDNTLLVTRSNEAGSELVYRHTLEQMTDLLQGPGFRGVMNLRAAGFERLQRASDFAPSPAGTLDLAADLEPLYPQNHTASTGFALALWLCEHIADADIVLAGFTGLRSPKWKVFHIHDWVFEQSVLQVLKTSGRLRFAERAGADPYAGLYRHFPDLCADDILLASVQTLSETSQVTKRHIDRLLAITAPLRAFYDLFKAVKPRTRKQRILAARAKRS